MAVSIPVSNALGSRVQAVSTLSAAGGSDRFRSQFLGSRRSYIPCGTRAAQLAVRNVAKAGAIRSASIFEKVGQILFGKDVDEEQTLAVYEINTGDLGSPELLRLCPKSNAPLPTLGDLVPYTNKVFDASGKVYLGLSAGLCVVIENGTGKPLGDRYETTYSHYLGGYGQLSAMGPYYSIGDSEMVVTGGTGIFKGARGIVKLHSVEPTTKILYTYHITGVAKLPAALTGAVVPLEVSKPSPVTVST